MRLITSRQAIITFFLVLFVLLSFHSADCSVPLPKVHMEWGGAQSPKEVTSTMQILVIITILSLAPAIMMMMTSFTRIVIVLSFLRQAMGTQQIPPNQVLISFALFLTFLTMMPTFSKINNEAIKPYTDGKISQSAALKTMENHARDFMLKSTRKKDLDLFLYASGTPRPATLSQIPILVLIPSYVLSELQTAFSMGFTLFITFLVIDMVVASILMSIGMFMLPPMMISLPIKIMIFVLVDGWYLVIKSLILSFR